MWRGEADKGHLHDDTSPGAAWVDFVEEIFGEDGTFRYGC